MPTYVLSKLKRSLPGQKVGDLIDQEPPTTALTAIASADRILVVDDSDSDKLKIITRTSFLTWLNGLIAPAWSRVSGKPSTFAPSTHRHDAAAITSGVFDAARIPSVPQLLVLADPADRTITENEAYSSPLAEATGGTSPYTYTLKGGLPTGMAFDDSTRVFSGTPSAAGEHELIYGVADAGTGGSAQTATQTFTVRIQPAGSRYITISQNATITASEITNGVKHAIDAQSLKLPAWTGRQYIGIAQPADQADLTRISLAGLGNSISDFTKAGYTREIASIDYEVWVGKEIQGDAISGEIIEVLP